MNTAKHIVWKCLLCGVFCLSSLVALRAQNLVVVPPNLDTVIVGRATTQQILVINRSTRTQFLRSLRIVDSLGIITLPTPFLETALAPFDTLFVDFRVQPREIGIINARFLCISNVDTTSAALRLIARLRRNEVSIRPGVRIIPDTAKPGDMVMVELFLAEGDKATLVRSALPVFTATLRMNGNLLQLTAQRNGVIALGNPTTYRFGPRLFQVPRTSWDGRSDVLFRFAMQAMMYDTDTTPVEITNFQWGEAQSSIPVSVPSILIDEPLSGRLTIQTCTAGGKRLFTTAKASQLQTSSIFPNPADAQSEAAYTLSKAQHVEVTLYNAQGNLVRRIRSGVQEQGMHSIPIETQSLAAGAYFVRIVGEEGIEQYLLNVVH